MVTELINNVINPSTEYTPIPFWFFNDEPDQDKIKKQLTDYVAKGVNGLVIHPRIGVPESIQYLSEKYFDVIKFVVKTAASLDMKIVLYDEGMYPSGSAHGLVVKANPKFAARGIIARDTNEEKLTKDEEVITTLSDGRDLVYGYTEGTIRGIHFGEDDGEPNAPKAADILNPDAVAEFIHLTHDKYYEELKEYFGNTIIGFFTDEPSTMGRRSRGYRSWCAGLEKEIIEKGGKLDDLAALFEKKENETTVIYHKLIKKHLAENFYRPLSEWCEAHGIAFMGHPAESDDVEEQKYFHIPGQDLIQRRMEPLHGGIYDADSIHPKLAADIARHSGRRRNANECFGVCYRQGSPWYFTGQDMKWYISWLGMRGTNLFIPHAFFYSVVGDRKEERPPDVGPNNIWWEYYKQYSDYMKRFSYLMTDSDNQVKVAVLCDNNNVPCKQVECLYENQIEFHYIPVAMLSNGAVKDNNFVINNYHYEYVINLIGADHNKHFASMSNVYTDIDTFIKECVDNSNKLNTLSTVRMNQQYKDVRVANLVKDGVKMYLLSNEGEETIHTTLDFQADDDLVIMNLWNGQYHNWSKGEDVTLQPCETVVLFVDAEHEIDVDPVSEIHLGNLTKQFKLLKKENNKAEYEYVLKADAVSEHETFVVEGEEMAECFCNGTFAGVSFAGPHKFDIGSCLKEGDNVIKVVMTGNASNIYENADVFYGLF